MKIKKQLNLPQLIEWAFENNVTGSIYSDDRIVAKKIRFEVGVITSMHGDMHKDDTFTVEVEEETTDEYDYGERFMCEEIKRFGGRVDANVQS